MPLNIIVKSGGRRNISDEEVAHYLAKREEERIVEEKHTYKERARKARKAAENMQLPEGVRARAVYDARTYFRHEQQNPGCMSDPSYTRELLRDNEEMRLS